MVTEEVRRAKQLQDLRPEHKPVILPIRVNFPLSSPLNYDLRGYLSQIQQREWKSPADTPRILQEILSLLTEDAGSSANLAATEELPAVAPAWETQKSPPLPVAEPELPEGQVDLLCKLIPNKIETSGVEELVRSHIITSWESQDEPEHLRTIRDLLLRNKQRTGRLLGLYKEILQQERIPSDDSLEQKELPLTGLVVKRQGHLEVYNHIYKAVFDQRWVNKELAILRPPFYHEAITAWLASNCEDESQLLQGNDLKDIQKWAAENNYRLSSEDSKFLNASLELYNRELEKVAEPTNLKFKHEKASSVVDLISLCDKYPDIAENYLFNSNYLEDWLFHRSETDLAYLSRKIASSYKQERRRGVEMFVRGLCEHLKRVPYPKILFEPPKLEFGEIPIGCQKRVSLKVSNNGRGFAWGDVIKPNLPGLSVPEQFDSSTDTTFDINFDALEVEPDDYQGSIFIDLKEMEYTCRIPISYKIKKLNISKPEKLELGVLSHGRYSFPRTLIITCESSGGRLKGIASTKMNEIEIIQHSSQGKLLEFSLSIDTTNLEAGHYNTEISIKTNTGEFEVPIYFKKSLNWDIITALTARICIPVGLVMFLIRRILGNYLSVGLDDNWVLSYPPEVTGASYLPEFFPFLHLSIFGIPEVQIICSIFGSLVFFICAFIFRDCLNLLKEKLKSKVEMFYNSINQVRENYNNRSSWSNQWVYNLRYSPSKGMIIIGWLIKTTFLLLILLWLIIFIINWIQHLRLL